MKKVIVFVFLILGQKNLFANHFMIQTVDSSGDVGSSNSIALDSSGNPHISYYDATNHNLKYAKWTGSSWSIQTVDSNGEVGGDTSIALDPSGNPNISYYDFTNGDLKCFKFINNPPSLSWSGGTGYESDGVNPDAGDTFIFKIKYTDIDNDAPASSYPKVHILKNGIEISGSPFSMSCSGSNYSSGIICSYSIVLTSTGTDYSYYFESKDSYGANATGTPTSSKSGPIVSHPPLLSWTGEPGYENDGVNPDVAESASNNYEFRIKYTDTDNDSPLTGYPKLHILKDGVEISNSPFIMNYISGSYNTGAMYSYTISSLEGGEYSYYFESKDTYGLSATGEPTTKKTFASIKNLPQTNDAKVYHGVFKPLQGEKAYISFSPQTTGKTTIKVYNTEGKEVKKLYEGTSTPGLNTITWEGTDESGNKLPSGVYLITIDAPGFKKTKKLVIVR